MGLYSVKMDPNTAAQRFNGKDAAIVQANTTTEAKKIAMAASAVVDASGFTDTALWNGATVTDLSAVPDLLGWTFGISVNTSTPSVATYTGIAGDTIDLVGAGLVAALNATGHGITHAAYNTSTNVLTVAGTLDTLGDKVITATVTPPAALLPTGTTVTTPYSTKTDGGSSGAALSIVLVLTWVIPGAVHMFRQ